MYSVGIKFERVACLEGKVQGGIKEEMEGREWWMDCIQAHYVHV